MNSFVATLTDIRKNAHNGGTLSDITISGTCIMESLMTILAEPYVVNASNAQISTRTAPLFFNLLMSMKKSNMALKTMI